MAEHLVVFITAGSLEEAQRIAMTLVAEKLAACVNIIPNITSVYRWEGSVQRDEEWLLLAKSHQGVLDDLVRRAQALHSYDLPEVIAVPLVAGSEDYLRWIDGAVAAR